MVELVEDCLDIIFGYLTPAEWIQISDVYRMWKMAVQKQWRKTTAITCNDYSRFYEEPLAVDISTRDARKIVLHAAQFCSFLTESTFNDTKNLDITVGPFKYRVINCTFEDCLRLVAKNASELTKVHFRKPPEPELLQLLFEANQIQTITCCESYDFWRDLSSMDAVENLNVGLTKLDSNIKSFEGLLPNLKTFELNIYGCKPHVVEEILSRTFPYVRGIKSLHLNIYRSQNQHLILKDVVKCFNLEHLTLSVQRWLFSDNVEFDEILDKLCPKLQVVILNGFTITSKALHSLLSLPNLKKLETEVKNFRIEKPLPEVVNLSEFSIYFDSLYVAVDITDLCDALKKMPKLERLSVEGLWVAQSFRLACEAIMAATSHGKVVVVERYDEDCCCTRELEVQSKSDTQPVYTLKKHQILTLRFEEISETYFDDIKTFVRRNLPSHNAV